MAVIYMLISGSTMNDLTGSIQEGLDNGYHNIGNMIFSASVSASITESMFYQGMEKGEAGDTSYSTTDFPYSKLVTWRQTYNSGSNMFV